MTKVCGACEERTARVFIKGLPALCVKCARNVSVPLKRPPLDYVTASGLANAKVYVEDDVAKQREAKRERRTQSQLLLNLRF